MESLTNIYSTTYYTLFLTAFLKSLNVWRADAADRFEELVIGSPISGRESSLQLNHLIGYFLNNLVICVNGEKLADATNAAETIELVKEAVKKAKEYSNVSFHRVVAELQRQRIREETNEPIEAEFEERLNPVFQVNFFKLY